MKKPHTQPWPCTLAEGRGHTASISRCGSLGGCCWACQVSEFNCNKSSSGNWFVSNCLSSLLLEMALLGGTEQPQGSSTQQIASRPRLTCSCRRGSPRPRGRGAGALRWSWDVGFAGGFCTKAAPCTASVWAQGLVLESPRCCLAPPKCWWRGPGCIMSPRCGGEIGSVPATRRCSGAQHSPQMLPKSSKPGEQLPCPHRAGPTPALAAPSPAPGGVRAPRALLLPVGAVPPPRAL